MRLFLIPKIFKTCKHKILSVNREVRRNFLSSMHLHLLLAEFPRALLEEQKLTTISESDECHDRWVTNVLLMDSVNNFFTITIVLQRQVREEVIVKILKILKRLEPKFSYVQKVNKKFFFQFHFSEPRTLTSQKSFNLSLLPIFRLSRLRLRRTQLISNFV